MGLRVCQESVSFHHATHKIIHDLAPLNAVFAYPGEQVAKYIGTVDPPPLSWSTLIVSRGGLSYGYQTT